MSIVLDGSILGNGSYLFTTSWHINIEGWSIRIWVSVRPSRHAKIGEAARQVGPGLNLVGLYDTKGVGLAGVLGVEAGKPGDQKQKQQNNQR